MEGVIVFLACLIVFINVCIVGFRRGAEDAFYYLIGSIVVWVPILVILHFIVKYW